MGLGLDLETRKILAKDAADIITELINPLVPGASVLKAVAKTGLDLRSKLCEGDEIKFSEIKQICKKRMPDLSDKYQGIVSAAADICLKSVDVITNPYRPKELAAHLTKQYICQHPAQFSDEELGQINSFLPSVLEYAICELNERISRNPSFLSEWRTATNSRIHDIETHQKERDKIISSHESRMTKYEQQPGSVYEYHSEYLRKWDDTLFLDSEKKLKDVYLLPDYQYYDYGDSDESADECGAVTPDDSVRCCDLANQLQRVVTQSNDLEKRMLVILGHPGAGKSTLITYLLNNCDYLSNRQIRVYRFSSFEKVDWNGKSENIPLHMLCEMGLNKEHLSNSLLILDGLDEATMRSGHVELLNEIYQQWAKAREIIDFSLVITCRRNRIDSLDDLQMRYILLCPFDASQIETFASKYWEKPISGFCENELKILNRINSDSGHLFHAMGIPLILYMTLALKINLSRETGLCDIYNEIFSVEDNRTSIYYRRYDRPHQITCNEAAQIHCFSKKIAQLIWEFNPSEGTVDCERYEPIANKIVEQNGTTGLRDLLIGQYFMEGKNGTQLLFVHRSMYEYFIALSFYDHIARLVSSGFTPKELYQEVSFDGGPNKLTQFTNLLGMQNLSSFPDIQGHLSQMLKKSPLGTLGWWHEFFSQFLNFGLANAAWGRSKSGVRGLSEELTRFYNLLWLVKEQLSSLGESAPFALCKNLEKSIYFRIPYDSQKDLQDLILDGIKLPCQNFCGARLRRLHMAESILSYADFSEASLNSANFRSSKMEQCDFSRADLTGADLSLANLEHSQFDSAILSHTNFRGANLTGAHFSYANLSHADFSEAILDGAIFTNATIENAIFDKASMQRVNLNHQSIKSTSFKSAILTESSLEGIHVSDNTSMQNAIMTSCNLSYSDFEKINLAFVTFENAQILSAYLCGCNLQGANLSQADLSDSHLRHADLNNSILRKAILDNADISGADLTNADLRGAYLTHTTLYHANLYKVKADQHMFNSAIFDSDDWTHWEIEYPNITNSNEASQVENTSILADLDWIPGDDGSRINWCELKIYEKLCTDFEESDEPYE